MSDCDTCIKGKSPISCCAPNADGSCAWWEQDPESPYDRFGVRRRSWFVRVGEGE